MNRSVLIAALFGPLLLPACAPAPKPVPFVAAPPVVADVTPGFNDREPDTCHAAALQALIGQPSGMLRTVAVPGPVRIMAPGALGSQDYDSQRIDVTVDAEGIVRRISCG